MTLQDQVISTKENYLSQRDRGTEIIDNDRRQRMSDQGGQDSNIGPRMRQRTISGQRGDIRDTQENGSL